MIYKKLTVDEAWDIAKKFERDNFTYEGFYALFEAIEGMFDLGDTEFDFIAWCCEWTQYASAWKAMEQYKPDDMPTIDKEDIDLLEISELQEKAALEWLHDNTVVIEFDGGVIIQNF